MSKFIRNFWAWATSRLPFLLPPISRKELIEKLPDGIIVTDALGRITQLNKAAKNILDKMNPSLAQSPLIGQNLAQKLNQWPAWQKVYLYRLEFVQMEVMIKDDCYIELKISLLKKKNGAFAGHLTVFRDISRFKQTEHILIQQANTDYLTGIPNRRHFLELSQQQFQIAARYGKPLSLILIDLDYFKQINDTFGHSAGDAVLTQFTQVCSNILRKADIFGRMGGEEFAVTLPETPLARARLVGEKIRRAVENTIFHVNGEQTIAFTISAGITSRRKEDISFESLLIRADQLLYQAKVTRNRIACDEEKD